MVNKKIKEVEDKIARIQRSTRTLFPFMTPAHEYCREHSKSYYRWHTLRFADAFHWLLLILFIAGTVFGYFGMFSAQKSQKAQAATETIRPTNAYNPQSWSNPANAYDGDTNTYANKYRPSATPSISLGASSGGESTDAWGSKTNTWTAATVYITFQKGASMSGCTTSITITDSAGTLKHTILAATYAAVSKTEYSQVLTESDWGSGFSDISDLRVRVNGASGGMCKAENNFIYDIRIDGTYSDAFTISGTCKQSDMSTNCTDSETVKVAYGTSVQAATGTTSSGSWSITPASAPSSGQVVTIFLDGVADTNEANNVTKYDGSGSITGVLLYETNLSIGSGDNQTLSNTDISTYDNSVSGDEDIFFNVDSSNDLTTGLSTPPTGSFYVKASNTYRPDSGSSGNLITHDIVNDGTITADGNTFNANGKWDNNSVFTAGESIVILSAVSGTETIDSTSATTASFNDLRLYYSGDANATYNLSSALDVNGDLTIDDDSLAMNGSNNINLAGNLSIGVGGNYTKGTGTFTFDGETGGSGSVGTQATIGTGSLAVAPRQLVRTSGGTLYSFINDGGSCEIWKSSDGSSWSEQDSSNNPSCTSGRAIAAAIDSSGSIHIAYTTTGVNINYNTFSTSTDTFGTAATAVSLGSYDTTDLDLAVDSNSIPHLVYGYADSSGLNYAAKYTNRVGGSWKSSVDIETNSGDVYPFISNSIVINEDNIPEVAYIDLPDDTVNAAVGNANNASSFTLADVDTSVNDVDGQRGVTIGVDSGGNTWVGYTKKTTNYVTLKSNTDGGSWTSWSSEITDSNVGYEVSITIVGTDIYAFYEDDNDDIVFDKYGTSWSGETVVGSGTYQDAHAKYSYYNNNGSSSQVDVIYSDGSNVYWNKYSFPSSASTWTDSRSTKADLGDVEINGTTKTVNLGSSATATSIDIKSSQTFGLGSSGYTFILTGSGTGSDRPLVVSGTLNEGSSSTVKHTGTSATSVLEETYNNLEVKPASGSPTYTIGTTGSAGGVGTQSKIDDSGDPGAQVGSTRQVIRTSAGTLYAFVNDTGSCEIWKSSDGSSWSEQDSSNNPACANNSYPISSAIDSSGVIHLAYYDDGGYTPIPLKYRPFSTSTDTFGTEETAESFSALPSQDMDLSVDSNNIPHLAYSYTDMVLGGDAYVGYKNRIGGSWKSTVVADTITTGSAPSPIDIEINEDNIAEIGYIDISNTSAKAAVGNVNNATSFTVQTLDSSVTITAFIKGISVTIDSSGNTWVSYVDNSTNYITLIKHNDGDAWSTWQSSITDSNVGYEPSIAANGSDVYLFYENDADDIAFDMYDGSWAGETTVATGTYQDSHAKWSYFNNNGGTNQMDVLYSDGTDVYWNDYSLPSSPGTITTTGAFTIGDGSNAVTASATTYPTTIDVAGAFTVASSASYTASATATFSVAGALTNSGTFTHSGGTITLDGTSTQTVTCGSSTFNNITSTNSSGLTFSGSCTTAGTFSHNTGSTTLTFGSGSTYAFNAIDIDGSASNLVTMISSSSGTQWYFNVTAATPTVTYVDAKDSNASGGSTIIASDGSCVDSGNNVNWDFTGSVGPVNDSLTFTNPYGGSGNTAIADDTTSWNFQAKVTDDDGPTDINYIELRLANGSDSSLPYDSLKFRYTRSTDTFSKEADTQNAATLTSTSGDATSSGNQWTVNFKIEINANFLDKNTNYSGELYSIDSFSNDDDTNYTGLYEVESLSLTLDVDSATVAFGNLLPGSVVTGTTITTVDTNYPNGYTLAIHDNVAGSWSTLLHTDSTTRIADYAGTIATPTTWSGTGLGICVYSATDKEAKWGTGTTEADSNNKYAGVPQTAGIIHTKTGAPTVSNATSIGYKVVVPNTQKTGSYSGDVTYTATGVLE